MEYRRLSFVGITHYKKTSERLPGKHHIDFSAGKNLVNVKVEQLLFAGADHVYISTNDTEVRSTDKVTYVYREEKYCDNNLEFSYVLEQIFKSIPITNTTDVIYTFVCCPLFSRYDEMYDKYLRTKNNQIAVYPSTHYYLDVNKRPINFNFGLWHPYSQGIDPVYMFPYAGTVCKMKDLRKVNYMIPQNFEYFPINQFESIDIDTHDEFKMAQKLYND